MSVSAARFGALGLKFLDDTFSDFAQSVVISELTKTADGQGGYTEVWSTFATVDAFVLKSGAKIADDEKYVHGRIATEAMYKFHISSLAGLTYKMKITHNSEDYQIRAVNDIAASNQWMIIDAERGVAQ